MAIGDFASLWLDDKVTNQPIRMDGDTLKPELGDTTFSAARSRWDALCRIPSV